MVQELMDQKHSVGFFSVGRDNQDEEYNILNILWEKKQGWGKRSPPRVDGSSSARASSQCQPRDKLVHAVIITPSVQVRHLYHHHNYHHQ